MIRFFHFSVICITVLFTVQSLFTQTMKVKVQIINNVPDPGIGNMTVSVNGDIKSGDNGIAFRQATPFFEVTALNDYVSVTYSGGNHQFNVPPAGDAVIFIYSGVQEPAQYYNPYNRSNLKLSQYAGMYAEYSGSSGKVALTIFQGSTDAPKINVINRKNNEEWASEIDYFNWSGFTATADKDSKVYEIEIRSSAPDTLVGAYLVTLADYGNKSLCLFTSGFVNPDKNQNGPSFGLFAADAEGNVVEFSAIDVKVKPPVPTIVSPADNAVNQPGSGYLSWESAIGAKSYKLQVSKTNEFAQNIIDENNLTSNSYQYLNLESETKYFWRVSAANEYGSSNWTEIRNFTIKKIVNKPSKPVLCFPAEDAEGVDINGIVYWNKIAGAEKYNLEIATDEDFLYTEVEQNDITDTVATYKNLKYNKLYYWHINGKNSAGTGAWSDPRTFKTKIKSSVNDNDMAVKQFEVQPNPVFDYLIIKSSQNLNFIDNKIIEIYNSMGERIYNLDSANLTNNEVRIDLSFLPSGFYFVKIGNQIQKFVKF